MIYIYNIILFIALSLALPFFAIKLIIDKCYRPGFFERLGLLPPSVIKLGQRNSPIWFHAASVGEVLASVKLLSQIKKRWPKRKIIVSTFTATGNQTAKEKLDVDEVIYLPLDLPFIVKKVVREINPHILIIMETEIWPNLIHEVSGTGAPIALVNGRISDKSFGKYRTIKSLLQTLFKKISLVMTQSENYRSRFISLGANPDRVKATGNIKFDVDLKTVDLDFMNEWQGKLFIAGSTRNGEEKLILDAYSKLRDKFSDLKLVLAPRHLERIGEIEGLLKERKLPYNKRSQIKSQINESILLLDTLGELSSIYRYADIVFIGGSLVPLGGQNPLEPALWGKAVLFGPHMENFREAAAILTGAEGGVMVQNNDELSHWIIKLLEDEKLLNDMGDRAKEAVMKNKGATEKTLEMLSNFIKYV